MTAENVAWYLGSHPEQWVQGRILAIERYALGLEIEQEPRWRLAVLLLVAVLATPALLLRQLGMALVAVTVWAVWRLLRRVSNDPNDVLGVLTDDELWLVYATSSVRAGWTVRGVIDHGPPSAYRSVIVGSCFELDLVAPKGQHLKLTPTHPTAAAALIAKTVAGRGESST